MSNEQIDSFWTVKRQMSFASMLIMGAVMINFQAVLKVLA
jgi:hypothetical protein